MNNKQEQFKFYGGKTIRYVAAAVGGYFLAKGDLSAADFETYMGAISTIGSVVASVWFSRKRRKAEASGG